jgi:hypothetical protein
MRRNAKHLVTGALVALTVAACGTSQAGTNAASGNVGSDLKIISPADNATVGEPFELTWTSAVPLGAPDTGKDHVHVFTDGKVNDYTVVGDTKFQIKGLSPGKHTVGITLQHADHSPAGAQAEITVNVTSGASMSTTNSTGGGSGSTGRGGYGY